MLQFIIPVTLHIHLPIYRVRAIFVDFNLNDFLFLTVIFFNNNAHNIGTYVWLTT